ncbi:hypothetical protein M436DRAFT_65408 [Aureobasidium namibiae CBS 147.97]|uniref:IBR domain-containing protein n=1 Tax=Aureobasidium namibiae CBS 147.97 TaxID=1043004 RepID=A0A074X9F6_9PEZI|nr:uncharacterized protein M436DRAFT_65408 [Aureobasidium namibiae CBS 147.97]KEQ71256.1 hypothetical protein M436DRAFT_65408 [Aureobasidium namibiae CBS 147.97]
MDTLVQTLRRFAVVEVLGVKVATEVEATIANIQEIKNHMIEIILPKIERVLDCTPEVAHEDQPAETRTYIHQLQAKSDMKDLVKVLGMLFRLCATLVGTNPKYRRHYTPAQIDRTIMILRYHLEHDSMKHWRKTTTAFGQMTECDVRRDKHENVFTPECDHAYCFPCLNQLSKQFIRQESTFPVSCCNHEVSYGQVQKESELHVRIQFAAAQEEYSRHHPYRKIGNPLISISRDRSLTKNFSHTSMTGIISSIVATSVGAGDTSTDAAVAQHSPLPTGKCTMGDAGLESLARTQGWQTCNRCKSVVQLSMGCNHVTCRCGHQFCYVCGAPWKTCGCQQWSERNLQQILAIQNREEPLPAGGICCVRHDWWIERGRAPCGECGRRRRALRCRNCPSVTCRECRDRAGAFGLLGIGERNLSKTSTGDKHVSMDKCILQANHTPFSTTNTRLQRAQPRAFSSDAPKLFSSDRPFFSNDSLVVFSATDTSFEDGPFPRQTSFFSVPGVHFKQLRQPAKFPFITSTLNSSSFSFQQSAFNVRMLSQPLPWKQHTSFSSNDLRLFTPATNSVRSIQRLLSV